MSAVPRLGGDRDGSIESTITLRVNLHTAWNAEEIKGDACWRCKEAEMIRVAFICVHNSCRSQIAEALGRHLAGDVFKSYSAGTETKPQIDQTAVRLMKQLHGIDMEATQHSKLLSDIPPVDVVVTMGCNVECPYLPCKHREDWGLDDPTGKSDEEFIEVIRRIESKILSLKERVKSL